MIKTITVTTLFLSTFSIMQFAIAEPPTTEPAKTVLPKPADGHTNLQHWTADQTKQVALEKKYKASILSDPENKKNYAYLAGLYLSNNMSSKAITAYQDAIIHDPTNPKLFAAISIAYLHTAKYGMAKAMADQALKLNPELSGVKKINEYVVAKQAAIKEASKVDASKVNAFKTTTNKMSHGASLPSSMGIKPSTEMHSVK